MPTVYIPHLLLPKAQYDPQKWAVIACDQFTSQREYWQALDATCGPVSTLRLIYPEYYLSIEDEATRANRIDTIHATMQRYLDEDIFEPVNDFVLVERTLPTGGVRVGMMVAIDLEEYDFHPESAAHIRATEATVESRLPVRIRIRDGAPLELSHALMLVDDRTEGILEHLYAQRDAMPLLYDVELNMGGGHLRGYRVPQSEAVLDALTQLTEARDFRYAVGDGNHSIAAAKTYWQQIRSGLTAEEAAHHPARYCTCELVNLNSDGLTFHPIHRVVYRVDHDTLIAAMKAHFHGTDILPVIHDGVRTDIPCDADATTVIEQMAVFFRDFCSRYPDTQVDYIHGEEHLFHVAEHLGGVGILMPSMPKSALFPYVTEHGILPKKAFSLGEAEEKRYYMEAKRIRK